MPDPILDIKMCRITFCVFHVCIEPYMYIGVYPCVHACIHVACMLTMLTDVPLNGIQNTLAFYIQLKIEDYDTEEVNPRLMPSYTNDSLSYRVPMNLK